MYLSRGERKISNLLILNGKNEIQISRLRLGKVNLNERLLLMKKHENGLCSLCKVRENIKHLLLDCNKENISNILRNTCIAYKMDFNINNLLDACCTQNAVFRLLSLCMSVCLSACFCLSICLPVSVVA